MTNGGRGHSARRSYRSEGKRERVREGLSTTLDSPWSASLCPGHLIRPRRGSFVFLVFQSRAAAPGRAVFSFCSCDLSPGLSFSFLHLLLFLFLFAASLPLVPPSRLCAVVFSCVLNAMLICLRMYLLALQFDNRNKRERVQRIIDIHTVYA